MAAESSTTASSGRSGVGGASADSYIGSLISLTSKSEIRYEGVLNNINTEESSIGLRNVRSYGTEGRKKDGPQVPPSDKSYEYILFRGSDIKDLQVKAAAPVQTVPPINSDPAIIQSHYPRPTASSTTLPTAPNGSLADLSSHSPQLGLPGSSFQSGLPLYQPGPNMNSWGPSPPNANGSGLPMPMYWQGFYGPNGMPQLPQQTLVRPPPGLSLPAVQFSNFNSSMAMGVSSFPHSSMPEYNPSLVANSASSVGLSSSSLPVSTLSLNAYPLQPVPLAPEATNSLFPNKASVSIISTPVQSYNFPSLAPLSSLVPDNAGISSSSNKLSAVSGPVISPQVAPQLIISPAVSSLAGVSGSSLAETSTPSLVTPGQLLQSGPAIVSSPLQSGLAVVPAPLPLQTTQKDVEVVQVLSKPSSTPSAPAVTKAQPPILPLPTNARAQKLNGTAYPMRNNYRGRGGRGSGVSRPVTRFTEEFDFMAMNEKFKKDEVWGHLGKSNKFQSNDKETSGSGSYEYDYSLDEDNVDMPKPEIKSVYNKDDFFDSLSCTTMDNDPNHGRTRYSEQMKLDTETFGDFSRFRGGRGGRGAGRGGGGRFRGSYYGGRGYGGHGYSGRGHGRGMQSHSS